MKNILLLLSLIFSLVSFSQNVVLITLDTTRRDALSCYGQKGIKTENLDNFAKKAHIFLNAYTPVPQTLPAHSTILTGLYPFDHKVRDNLINYLPEDAITLAEILKEKGYATGAVISSAVLDHRFGLNQGFDYFEDKVNKKTAENEASVTTNKALELLKNLKEPYFLWVHYYDPHHPYKPPEEIKAPTPYLAEVLYMDKNLKPLLESLNYENTLIIIAGDHGESLGDHNESEHGLLLYQSAIQIPLLIHFPKQSKKIEVKENVSLLGIFPTVLDFLKIKENPKNTLLKIEKEPIYLETYFPFYTFKWSPLKGIIRDNFKFIITVSEEELYNLKKDPQETINLVNKKKDTSKKLREELLKITPEKDFIAHQSKSDSIPEEIKKQLQSLGYLDGSFVDPREAKGDLPNPKYLVDLVDFLVHDGKKLLAEKRAEEVIKKVKEVLRRDPNNFIAMNLAGEAYWLQDNYERAKEIFEEALKIANKNYHIMTNLGFTLMKLNKPKEAKEILEKSLSLNEYFAETYVYLSEYYLNLKDTKNAENILKRAIEKRLAHPRLYFNYGLLKLENKDLKNAIKYFEKAVELDESFKEAIGNLALCYYKTGEKTKSWDLLQRGLKLAPKDFKFLKAAITVALDLNKLKEAEDLAKKLIELYPDSPEAKSIRPFFKK